MSFIIEIKNKPKNSILEFIKDCEKSDNEGILSSDNFKIQKIEAKEQKVFVYIDTGYTFVYALEYLAECFQSQFIYNSETNNHIMVIN